MTTTLPVRVEFGRIVIGPGEIPGTPGCAECLRIRNSRAQENRARIDAVLAEHRPVSSEVLVTDSVRDVVAAIDANGIPPATVVCVDLASLRVTRHRFLPEPFCPVCGDLPEDGAEHLALAPRPKPRPDVHRVRDVAAELDTLLDTYVDAETGLVRLMKRGVQGGLVVAGAMMPIRIHGAVEPGVGRSRSYRTSELTGLLEALERYGGVEPGGKRTVVHASYAEIADTALDPRTLGVHPAESHALPDFGFREFTEDARCRWVWGYSFGRKEPVLVPESLAYYYVQHRDPDDRPFVYEISNGCALGACLEEAILYGLLEAVERDAFLMAWYNRTSLPRVDLGKALDRDIPLQAAAITADTGYEVQVYDSTTEHGIPSVWVMAVRPGEGDGPKLVCAAGAHLTLERAIMSGLSELGPLLADFIGRYPEERADAEAMVTDADLVRTMHDHSTLYGADAAFDRLDFLTGTPHRRELPVESTAFRSFDLTDDLTEAVDRVLAAGMDVVVVDQTTPEHRAGGFSCVKVLVPGAVPMTFGHRNRRVDGLPRLARCPNPHPHPFP